MWITDRVWEDEEGIPASDVKVGISAPDHGQKPDKVAVEMIFRDGDDREVKIFALLDPDNAMRMSDALRLATAELEFTERGE